VTVLREGELEFDFSTAVSAFRFDAPAHGLSHCMKAVDFVVEYPAFYLFVEVKDPDNTKATSARRAEFANKLTTEHFVHALTRKYRDSWLYQWAVGTLTKPVHYVVLLQLSSLQPPALSSLRDRIRREVPVAGPSVWERTFIENVIVMNIAAWNAHGQFGNVKRTWK
jgi:hypothetical protein